MSVKKASVRRAASHASTAIDAPACASDGELDKSDFARRGILDATIGCFAEFGWGGTNMSVIARRSRMTRGRIQYYFPTLDGLLRAAIEHLVVEWRKKYFSSLSDTAGMPARFDTGITALWSLMQDPLNVAKQELEASARTNRELRALLHNTGVDEDEASVEAAKRTYPELAQFGDAEFRRALNFTMVFMEGLTLHGFGSDAERRREELIEMLKGFLIAYWSALGVENLKGTARPQKRSTPPPFDEEKRTRPLDLIQEAASLLSSHPGR